MVIKMSSFLLIQEWSFHMRALWPVSGKKGEEEEVRLTFLLLLNSFSLRYSICQNAVFSSMCWTSTMPTARSNISHLQAEINCFLFQAPYTSSFITLYGIAVYKFLVLNKIFIHSQIMLSLITSVPQLPQLPQFESTKDYLLTIWDMLSLYKIWSQYNKWEIALVPKRLRV